jgi:hypothetical protein
VQENREIKEKVEKIAKWAIGVEKNKKKRSKG